MPAPAGWIILAGADLVLAARLPRYPSDHGLVAPPFFVLDTMRFRLSLCRSRERTMRIVLAAALLAGPTFAQNVDGHVPRYGEEDKEKTAEQKRAEKAAQDAYQRSLSNIPDKGPTDPWGAVRSTDTPKSATNTAKPKKTKTGSADAKQ